MGIVDIHSLGYYNVTRSVMFFDKRGNNQISPYKVPNLHPQKYYKTSQNREVEIKIGPSSLAHLASWNPLYFMKSSRFHNEIWEIS